MIDTATSQPVHQKLLDFTRFSVIPSVVFQVNIPESISGSWYDGNVHVIYKDGAFEPSSPIRHAAELVSILRSKSIAHPVVFLYSDGGAATGQNGSPTFTRCLSSMHTSTDTSLIINAYSLVSRNMQAQ